MTTVKQQLEMTSNQQRPVQQLYEEERSTQRAKSAAIMSDYKDGWRWWSSYYCDEIMRVANAITELPAADAYLSSFYIEYITQ